MIVKPGQTCAEVIEAKRAEHGNEIPIPYGAIPPLDSIVELLRYVGEDPERDGLKDTPARVLKAFAQLTVGYHQKPDEILATQFVEPCDEMIVVRDVPFWSLCEHHMLPFQGKATVAYIPRHGKVVGLSKLARLVQCFSKRLQIQERLTTQVVEALEQHVSPDAACVITANHTCMQMRGVQSAGELVTSKLGGLFKTDASARAEFMAHAQR
jgi:GTP cyclohydrolase I